jgi:hypothetical protein
MPYQSWFSIARYGGSKWKKKRSLFLYLHESFPRVEHPFQFEESLHRLPLFPKTSFWYLLKQLYITTGMKQTSLTLMMTCITLNGASWRHIHDTLEALRNEMFIREFPENLNISGEIVHRSSSFMIHVSMTVYYDHGVGRKAINVGGRLHQRNILHDKTWFWLSNTILYTRHIFVYRSRIKRQRTTLFEEHDVIHNLFPLSSLELFLDIHSSTKLLHESLSNNLMSLESVLFLFVSTSSTSLGEASLKFIIFSVG